jgi:hypothetical protein
MNCGDLHFRNDNAQCASDVTGGPTIATSAPCLANAARRQWTAASAALAGLLWSGRFPTLRTSMPDAEAAWTEALARLASNEGVHHVAAMYLACCPREAATGTLVSLIGDGAAISARGLAHRIDLDWRRQDVAVISGWVLSRTEVRLCALLHLHRAGQ